jgi:hypothetical protein
MNKQIKAFIYNLIGFVFFYVISYLLLFNFTGLTGYWIPVAAALITMILAPKFQFARQAGGDKIFMSWLFLKGIKEIK